MPICPHCKGRGFVPDPQPVTRGRNRVVICEPCKGEGTLPQTPTPEENDE